MRGCFEPFQVECESEVHFQQGDADALVCFDGGEGGGDAGVVFRDGVAPVHEVVGHDIEEVQGGVDGGDGGVGEGKHVPGETGNGGGNEFVGAEGGADLCEEEGVGGYFPGFLGVGGLFVIFAVAAGVGG